MKNQNLKMMVLHLQKDTKFTEIKHIKAFPRNLARPVNKSSVTNLFYFEDKDPIASTVKVLIGYIC